MKIKWEVSEGYGHGDCPHYLEIQEEEFEDCETEEEKRDLIAEYVQAEFEEKVSYSWEIIERE